VSSEVFLQPVQCSDSDLAFTLYQSLSGRLGALPYQRLRPVALCIHRASATFNSIQDAELYSFMKEQCPVPSGCGSTECEKRACIIGWTQKPDAKYSIGARIALLACRRGTPARLAAPHIGTICQSSTRVLLFGSGWWARKIQQNHAAASVTAQFP
jgi:hypothetical protein